MLVMMLRASSQITSVCGGSCGSPRSFWSVSQPSSNAARVSRAKRCASRLAAPRPVVERLALVKRTADFQTPLPLQAAIASFLRAGLDREARRARASEVETRREEMSGALGRHLPDLSWWDGEPGSAIFWLILPPGVSGRRVAEAAAARGVAVSAGADFDPEGEDRGALRLSVSRVERESIERGVALLAEAVRETRARASVLESAPVV